MRPGNTTPTSKQRLILFHGIDGVCVQYNTQLTPNCAGWFCVRARQIPRVNNKGHPSYDNNWEWCGQICVCVTVGAARCSGVCVFDVIQVIFVHRSPSHVQVFLINNIFLSIWVNCRVHDTTKKATSVHWFGELQPGMLPNDNLYQLRFFCYLRHSFSHPCT